MMDRLLKQFSEGVLCDLENLDVAAKDQRTSKQQLSADRKSLHQLQRKVSALEQRKKELQRKLKIGEENLSAIDQPHKKKKSDELSNSLVELKKLTEVADFYRLSGISIDSEKDNKIVVRFDTSCDGIYSKSYFLEMEKEWNNLVHHHTLPSFIPVTQLAAQCDLLTFVGKIRLHLYAFTSRQNQIKAFQAKYSRVIRGEIESSFPIDYVGMTISPFDNTYPLRICLVYDNLVDCLPTSVSLEPVTSGTEDLAEPNDTLLQEWTELFKTMSMTDALTNIVTSETQVESETSDFTSEL